MKHSLNHFLQMMLTLTLLAACGQREKVDAYGILDARKWTVSLAEDGQLVRLDVQEGDVIAKDAVVGQLDTGRLALEKQASLDQIRALRPTLPNVGKQMEVLENQKEALERERDRLAPLVSSGTASRSQLDAIEDRIRVTVSQMEAARSSLSRESAAVYAQMEALKSRVRVIEDRIARCSLVNPEDGTVIACLVRRHEYVRAGHPIYVLADLKRLYVNAYLEGRQLCSVSLGDTVRVRVDDARGGVRTLPGRVSYIAEEAEFTPTNILTRDTRTTLVYHVRIDLPEGESGLRSGMPAEILLGAAER